MNRDAGRLPTVEDAVATSAVGAVLFIVGLMLTAASLLLDPTQTTLRFEPMIGATFMLVGLLVGCIGFIVVLGLSGGPDP